MIDLRSLEQLDRVVYEPARLMILAALHAVEAADFTFLKQRTGLTGGNLSFHISKLEDAGFVEVRKEFVGKVPRTVLELTDSGREALTSHVEVLKGFVEAVGG